MATRILPSFESKVLWFTDCPLSYSDFEKLTTSGFGFGLYGVNGGQ